ncbi:MAG: alpha/beta fold hydrolase [Corynebacterium provencense]|jgi:3-oxoadipate enol-lactonase|uniref:alpha/beta fold hydrolase n=1 Tax=Corynebacterium provencense TaxID=1737425 RepID=UPI002989AA2B|nr:alpha/beta fold hydrolase [Corynebacterium provencense]
MTMLHARTTGSGHRVAVLLGALGSSADMWAPLQDALSGTGDADLPRLTALELRGHGASPMPPVPPRSAGHRDSSPTTVSDLAGDVLTTLDGLGIDHADIVGLSIGGAVAQYLAARHSDRVTTLTLMCTAPVFGEPSDWTTRATAVRARGTDTLRELAETTVQRWLTGEFRRTRPGTALSVEEMISRTTPSGYAACCDALSTFDGRDLLGDITAPTLTLAATWDRTCPPTVLEQMNAAVGNPVRHVELPAAHLLPVELPGQVADVLRDFWAGA